MHVTYTKLKSGAWGIRVSDGTVVKGQTVTVQKKSGDTRRETVTKVLWTDSQVTLCAIEQRRRMHPGMDCPGCGCEPLNEELYCWECGFQG